MLKYQGDCGKVAVIGSYLLKFVEFIKGFVNKVVIKMMVPKKNQNAPKRTFRQLQLGECEYIEGDSKLQPKRIGNKSVTKMIRLTERIQIKATAELHDLFRCSKDLFNKANTVVHQGFHMFVFWNNGRVQKAGKRVWHPELDRELQGIKEYRALPAKTSQKILRQVEQAWTGYFETISKWKKDLQRPKNERRFRGKPNPPGYKKVDQENLLYFTNQQAKIKHDEVSGDAYLTFPKAVNIPPIKVNAARIAGKLQVVRILPRGYYCIVEIVYKKEYCVKGKENNRIVAIDLGVRNLVCIVNNVGLKPIVVRGGVVKSINAYYNKQRSHYQQLYKALGIEGTPKRVERLTRKRNNLIENIFHKLSREIIVYCKAHQFRTIVIGYNPQWKQNCNIGRRNNQNFINIPFYRLVQKIRYKAELVNINVKIVEESHTSKCSFLDYEEVGHHETYMGTRGVYQSKKEGGSGQVSHGLFKTAKGQVINADVNGALNILMKAFPNAFADGREGIELVPVAVKFSKKDQDFTQLKHLANLYDPIDALPKTVNVDGREIGGVSIGGVDSQSIKFYTK